MRSPPLSGSFSARALRIGWRAVGRRCPNCGGGRIFLTWFRLKERCPTCGMGLEREEGYRVGAYMFNIAMAEAVFILILAGVVVVTWPTPPWSWITWVSGLAVIGLPISFYPYSQTLFIGFDLLFHPAEPGEFKSE